VTSSGAFGNMPTRQEMSSTPAVTCRDSRHQRCFCSSTGERQRQIQDSRGQRKMSKGEYDCSSVLEPFLKDKELSRATSHEEMQSTHHPLCTYLKSSFQPSGGCK